MDSAHPLEPSPGLPATDTAAPSDEALMHAYGAGELEAFEALYQRYRGALYRFFSRQTGSPALGEELMQESFMRLIHARSRYRPDAPFKVYFWRIARNLLIDHYRRQSRSLPDSYQATDPDQLVACERVEPHHSAQQGQQVARLLSLISELPCAQREAFLLREETGLGLVEIAALTQVSRDTVKSRLRYAIDKLRQGMEAP